MIVEFLGAPGSGKSALMPAVIDALAERGVTAFTVVEAARPFAARTILGRVATRLLPETVRDPVLWRIFLALRLLHAAAFFVIHPALFRVGVARQWLRSSSAEARTRRVAHWYVRWVGSYAFLAAHLGPDEALVVDEGFVHRVVQLFSSVAEDPDPEAIRRYLAKVPPPSALVSVYAPLAVCLDRVRERGVWERFEDKDPGYVDEFVGKAHRTTTIAAEWVDRVGWPSVEVDNGGDDVSEAATVIRRWFGDGPAIESGSGALGVRSRLAVRLDAIAPLKPRAAVEMVQAKTRRPAIGGGTVAALLAQYGLTMTRSPRNVPAGWRNRIVVVDTGRGKRVLKQYRGNVDQASVRWEHSILDRLEEIDFPAVRLDRTLAGTTSVEVSGRTYALFAYVPGRNLTGRYLTRSHLTAVLTEAGATLARFDRALEGFQPEGRHRLGFLAHAGNRTRDLGWHLATLEALPEHPGPDQDPDTAEQVAWLDERRADIGQRLGALAESIDDTRLNRTVIHGDFGLHNLLVRDDGTAVVHDLELARIEWRAIDLIVALARIRPHHRGAFVDGYRRENDLTDDEWELFPSIWQYYRLRGAIQSWHSFVERGGRRRLATAQRRVLEADSIATQQGPTWW